MCIRDSLITSALWRICDSERAASTTDTPALASWAAVAAPIPRLAPVTIAAFPCSSCIVETFAIDIAPSIPVIAVFDDLAFVMFGRAPGIKLAAKIVSRASNVPPNLRAPYF